MCVFQFTALLGWQPHLHHVLSCLSLCHRKVIFLCLHCFIDFLNYYCCCCSLCFCFIDFIPEFAYFLPSLLLGVVSFYFRVSSGAVKLLIWDLDRVSLCSLVYPWTHSVDQDGLELTEISLPLLSTLGSNANNSFLSPVGQRVAQFSPATPTWPSVFQCLPSAVGLRQEGLWADCYSLVPVLEGHMAILFSSELL